MKRAITAKQNLFQRLSAIHRTVAPSLDFEEALGLIAGCGLEFVGAASCLVLLQEGEDALRICAAQGVDPKAAERFVGPMQESVLDELMRHLGFSPSESVAAAPIMTERGVQGILVVIRDSPLSPEEACLLSALADQAAITLENAHRHQTLVSRHAMLEDEVDRSRKLAGELDALIQSAARDLREPLRIMAACSRLLLNECGKESLTLEGRKYLSRIAWGAGTMEALIQDLLAYTHLTRAELILEPVDLEGAVSEALAEFQTEIESRRGLVRVEVPLPNVLAHRKTLVRILKNLLSNAVKFVIPGVPPLVEARAEVLGDWVRLSVADHGIGIREADLDRIFAAFERLNRAEEYPGTGLGLAIVQKGMERMGGRSGVESKVGKGSHFWIELRGVNEQAN